MAMPRKPLELSTAVARAFVKDMRAFHSERNAKRDEIALRQLHALKQHVTAGTLRLFDVMGMFEAMKDHA